MGDEIDALARRLYEALVADDGDWNSREVLKVGYLIVHGMFTDDDEGCRWCGQLPEVGRTACQACIDSGPGPHFPLWEQELRR